MKWTWGLQEWFNYKKELGWNIVEQSAYVYVQYMRRGLQMFDIDSVEAPDKVCPDLYGLLAVFFSVFQC